MSHCEFCEIDLSRVLDEDKHSFVVQDAYPISTGHMLVVPKAHVADWFELSTAEHVSMIHLLQKHRARLMQADSTIDGFNFGANCGESAGQTIMHCHLHLVPRRFGDADDPRGGIRWVLPASAKYWVD